MITLIGVRFCPALFVPSLIAVGVVHLFLANVIADSMMSAAAGKHAGKLFPRQDVGELLVRSKRGLRR